MAKKKATSMDVAREAGVSQATVSMILNKKYNVSFSKETIRQVTEAAEKLDLSPAKTADPPVGKEQKTSGCVLPDTDKPLLCHAAARHRSHGKRIRVRRVCLQHPEGSEDRGKLSADDAGSAAAGNHLCL